MSILVAATPGLAYEPARQTNEMEGYTSNPILTRAGAAAQAKKLAAFEDFQASRTGAGGSLALAATAHTVPSYERQQINSYYCGPAAAQDVGDYAWNKGATAHKYTQVQISDNWTSTTTDGTTIPNEVNGANHAINGSPHDNGNYNFASYAPTSGADWWSHLQFDIDNWVMPQILNLKPWWYTGSYWIWLKDWANHQSTGGHYVVANGYKGEWDTSVDDNLRWDDGADGYGGGTGTYWDSGYDVWRLIHNHYNIVIW